jgi:hypothetical protein
MEKICTLLWKPHGATDDAFRDALLAEAPELGKQGAMRLRISAVDGHVAAGAKNRVGRMDPPKSALVSYWVHEADARGPVEARLAARASKLSSFLIVESEPIRNTDHVAPFGQRTPGFNLVTGIEPKDGMSYADFIAHWYHEHRRCAVETQSTFAYVRNEIVRPLSPGAPGWAAIVEEHFPIEALSDPMVWYKAEGSKERFQRNLKWMIESCAAFLAMDRVDSHPMSEYVFER